LALREQAGVFAEVQLILFEDAASGPRWLGLLWADQRFQNPVDPSDFQVFILKQPFTRRSVPCAFSFKCTSLQFVHCKKKDEIFSLDCCSST